MFVFQWRRVDSALSKIDVRTKAQTFAFKQTSTPNFSFLFLQTGWYEKILKLETQASQARLENI